MGAEVEGGPLAEAVGLDRRLELLPREADGAGRVEGGLRMELHDLEPGARRELPAERGEDLPPARKVVEGVREKDVGRYPPGAPRRPLAEIGVDRFELEPGFPTP